METKSLEVFSEASNFGIVRMPGRRFPGCVVQGDSLSVLVGAVKAVLREAVRVEDRPLAEEARELYVALRARLDHYEWVLEERGMELPYPKREAPGEAC